MKRCRSIKLVLILLLMVLVPKVHFGQSAAGSVMVDTTSKDSVIMAWLENLYKEGVTVANDSVTLSEETNRLLTDEAYRKIIYPGSYNWDRVRSFIQAQDLRKAYWYMINLYLTDEKSKEMCVQFLLMYDRLFKMDKILVNTFYTYVLTDPEIGNVVNGHFKVMAPHIMEKKLTALREILFYLDKYKPENRKEQ
jgi:hypothetical protein